MRKIIIYGFSNISLFLWDQHISFFKTNTYNGKRTALIITEHEFGNEKLVQKAAFGTAVFKSNV